VIRQLKEDIEVAVLQDPDEKKFVEWRDRARAWLGLATRTGAEAPKVRTVYRRGALQWLLASDKGFRLHTSATDGWQIFSSPNYGTSSLRGSGHSFALQWMKAQTV